MPSPAALFEFAALLAVLLSALYAVHCITLKRLALAEATLKASAQRDRDDLLRREDALSRERRAIIDSHIRNSDILTEVIRQVVAMKSPAGIPVVRGPLAPTPVRSSSSDSSAPSSGSPAETARLLMQQALRDGDEIPKGAAPVRSYAPVGAVNGTGNN